MEKAILILAASLLVISSIAQKKALSREMLIPMKPEAWLYKEGKVSFVGHNGQPAIRLLQSADVVTSRNLLFSNGIIEFDVEPLEPGFTSVYFRMQDMRETECFYLRAQRAGNPAAADAVQYAPFIRGVNLWDLLPQYQAAADIFLNKPNHIKLVVSGLQLLAYVNDMQQPALRVSRLEGNTKDGAIAFDGKVILSNVRVRPDQTEGLPPEAGFDLTLNDPRYIRNWQASAPLDFPAGKEPYQQNLPDSLVTWSTVIAERAGLINLTRLYGGSRELNRRLVWLKVILDVKDAMKRKMAFGFSDEVWVFLNGRMVFADKNLYLEGMRKEPDGRISIENATFDLNLKQGSNELLIGVANNFYGWGIIAWLASMDGVVVK